LGTKTNRDAASHNGGGSRFGSEGGSEERGTFRSGDGGNDAGGDEDDELIEGSDGRGEVE